eukprot:m.84437 g.84437  ORF g.84437 m.84437 type:complete len:188 (+) comp36410_c0_seq4:1562-2125(+)
MSEDTKRRIKLLGHDWKSSLTKYIPQNELVEHYGGSQCDSTGDCMCKEHICYGGTVPRQFYATDCGNLSGMEDKVVQMSVARGSCHLVDVEVARAGSLISWEYKTSSHDIGFGLFFKGQIDSSVKIAINEMDEIIKVSHEECSRVPVDGNFQTILAGTYVICFDNRHSWILSKKLFYAIDVDAPVDL